MATAWPRMGPHATPCTQHTAGNPRGHNTHAMPYMLRLLHTLAAPAPTVSEPDRQPVRRGMAVEQATRDAPHALTST